MKTTVVFRPSRQPDEDWFVLAAVGASWQQKRECVCISPEPLKMLSLDQKLEARGWGWRTQASWRCWLYIATWHICKDTLKVICDACPHVAVTLFWHVLTSGMDVRSEPSHRNRVFCQAATTLPCTQSCQGLSKSSLGWISPAIKLYYLKIIQPRLCKCRVISRKQATISTTFTWHIRAMKRTCSLAICLRVK